MQKQFKDWLNADAKPDTEVSLSRVLIPRTSKKAAWALLAVALSLVGVSRFAAPARSSDFKLYLHETGTPESTAMNITLTEVHP